jgi:hypothetical protein
MRAGERIWQLGFGSGFKCNSAVWRANRTFKVRWVATLKRAVGSVLRPTSAPRGARFDSRFRFDSIRRLCRRRPCCVPKHVCLRACQGARSRVLAAHGGKAQFSLPSPSTRSKCTRPGRTLTWRRCAPTWPACPTTSTRRAECSAACKPDQIGKGPGGVGGRRLEPGKGRPCWSAVLVRGPRLLGEVGRSGTRQRICPAMRRGAKALAAAQQHARQRAVASDGHLVFFFTVVRSAIWQGPGYDGKM